jgi:Icc-related predicted phosphoesterase
MNNHVYRQCREYEKDDIIVKLENFDNEIIKAYDRPKYNVLIPNIKDFLLENKNKNTKLNISKKITESIGFVGLVEYTPDSVGPWSQYKDFYNKEIQNMVYEIYKLDFNIFNYDKNII